MRKNGQVSLDGFGPYPAEIDQDQRWNGFALPRFTREVAERIVREICGDGDDTTYTEWRWEGDVMVIGVDPEAYGEPSPDERFEPDPDGMYAIGAWSWCWDDEYPDESTEQAPDTNKLLTSFRDAMERARAAGAVEESEQEQTAIQEALSHAEALDAAMLDGAAIPADWITGRLTLSTEQIRNGEGYLTDAEWLKL